MFLLDTNVCIRLMNNSSPILVQRVRAQRPSALFISIITKGELAYGAYNSQRVAENLLKLHRFLEPYSILSFDDACIDAYGRARADLKRLGTPVGPNDVLIAATSISHNLTLVTANTSEFAHIPGLRLENWEV